MSKQKNHKALVLTALRDGQRSITDIKEATGLSREEIKKALYHQIGNLVDRDSQDYQGNFWLTAEGQAWVEENAPEKPQKAQSKTPPPPHQERRVESHESPPPPEEPRNLDQRDLFTEQLKAVGVRRDVIATITDIFFTGDINDMRWAEEALGNQAAGYVSPTQKKLVLSWWARTRGLEYEGSPAPAKEVAVTTPAPASTPTTESSSPSGLPPLDLGMGYDVQKVEGEWRVVPNGPMTYKEAWDRLERQRMLDNLPKHPVGSTPAGSPAGGGENPAGAAGPTDLMNLLMTKMIDNLFEKKDGGDSQLVGVIQGLQQKVADLQNAAQNQRLEQIETALSQVLTRDPVAELQRVQQMKAALGVPDGGPVVTDQSPAVQLIKDSTDKLDRNVNHLIGVFERVMLRNEKFIPENTRSPEERTSMAASLLEEVEGRERFSQVRSQAFGI